MSARLIRAHIKDFPFRRSQYEGIQVNMCCTVQWRETVWLGRFLGLSHQRKTQLLTEVLQHRCNCKASTKPGVLFFLLAIFLAEMSVGSGDGGLVITTWLMFPFPSIVFPSWTVTPLDFRQRSPHWYGQQHHQIPRLAIPLHPVFMEPLNIHGASGLMISLLQNSWFSGSMLVISPGTLKSTTPTKSTKQPGPDPSDPSQEHHPGCPSKFSWMLWQQKCRSSTMTWAKTSQELRCPHLLRLDWTSHSPGHLNLQQTVVRCRRFTFNRCYNLSQRVITNQDKQCHNVCMDCLDIHIHIILIIYTYKNIHTHIVLVYKYIHKNHIPQKTNQKMSGFLVTCF